VLDPSPDWKSKIDTLIAIPNGLAGEKILRGGSYFEALFQLAIAIDVLPAFRGFKTFYDIKGYKTKTTLSDYIHTKDVKNAGGGETGIADIMFELGTPTGSPAAKKKCDVPDYECGERPEPPKTTQNPYYFISVKGYRKEKSIAHGYDISLLFQQLAEFPEIVNRNIAVCVRNKEEFLTRLGRTQQEFLRSSISKVVGYDEVMEAFEAFRIQFFLGLPPKPTPEATRVRALELFPRGNPVPKPMLSLYFHQELVVKSVTKRIQSVKSGTKPHFLCIGVLPRGGKSFIAGGIIDALRKTKGKDKPFNVLFLTSAISETREQFQGDLIEKFHEFSDFAFVDPVRGGSMSSKSNFVFLSRQLSSKQVDLEEAPEVSIAGPDLVKVLTEKLGSLPAFDLCFFDEAHIGIKSDTVRTNFQKAFEQFKLPIVMMTATYKTPAVALDGNEDLFVWDLQDIRSMRELPTIGFDGFLASKPDVLQRYPGTAEEVLVNRRTLGETESQLARPYVNFPNPNFISLTFAPKTIEYLRDTGEGYDYTKAFQFKKGAKVLRESSEYKEWSKLLTSRDEALRLREFLTPEETGTIEILVKGDRKYRALNQIFRIAHESGSRPVQGKPFSILMFLPFGPTLPPIGEMCRVWASFLLELPYWQSNFVFLTLSTLSGYKRPAGFTLESAIERGICHREDFDSEGCGLKDIIQRVERAALEKNKGLVLLSGDVAKMGISLKCVDVVCLMSANKDADDIIQKIYRALTDDPRGGKKNGFIVDLNLKRIVTAMFDYIVEKQKRSPAKATLNTEELVKSTFELCNWGQDSFIEDEAAKGRTFDDIMNDIKSRVHNQLSNRFAAEHTRSAAKQQLETLKMNGDLYATMIRVLKPTTSTKKGAKTTELVARSPSIPDATGPTGATPQSNAGAEPPPPDTGLTNAQIESKMEDILATFANGLVIRSSERWGSDMNFGDLFAKFQTDKPTATKVCECESTAVCNVPHANLYDSVFCALKPYAYRPLLRGKTLVVDYDEPTHTSIMNLLESVFASPSPEWNRYVKDLIKELGPPSPSGGSRSGRTRKNGSFRTRHGRRRTYRNRP
jgi:hypothetical protein